MLTVLVMNAAGYVQKMPAEAFGEYPGTYRLLSKPFRCPSDPSRLTYSSEARTTFEGIDSRLVVGVHDSGRTKSAKHLSRSVDGEVLPRELAEDAVREGDGRVDMGSADTGRIHPQHHA